MTPPPSASINGGTGSATTSPDLDFEIVPERGHFIPYEDPAYAVGEIVDFFGTVSSR